MARRAALVTELPGGPLETSTLAAIRRAGELLGAEGWEIEEAVPPELTNVADMFKNVLAADHAVLAPQLRPFISDALYAHPCAFAPQVSFAKSPNYRLQTERSRLIRAWSGFFLEYPVVIGPNWGSAVWPIDEDLKQESGVALLEKTVRFMTPGNALGIPSVAMPMGVVDGLPTGIEIYADLWREDLCLSAAEIIERGVTMTSPIDPIS